MINTNDFFALSFRLFKVAVLNNKLYKSIFRPRYRLVPFMVSFGGDILKEKVLNLPVYLTLYQPSLAIHPVYGKITTCITYIRCRPIGTSDIQGNEIYESDNNTFFVFQYTPPTENSPDIGYLTYPSLNLQEKFTSNLQETYEENAKQLLKDIHEHLDYTNELHRLKIINRIITLQKNATVQQYMKDFNLSNS